MKKCFHRRASDLNGEGREKSLCSIFCGIPGLGLCISSFHCSQVGIEEDRCQRVVSQLCGALSHLHSLGFVHRDLKPENVFLCDAACRWVKLGDYGMVSANLKSSSLSKSFKGFFYVEQKSSTVDFPPQVKPRGTRVPEVWYSSPYCPPEAEVARGNGGDAGGGQKSRVWVLVEPSTDSWALGILTYAMLTGAHPWAQTASDCVSFQRYTEWFEGSGGAAEEPGPGGRAPVAPQFACFTPLAHDFFRSLLHPSPQRRGRPEDGLSYLGGDWVTQEERVRLEEERKRTRGSGTIKGKPGCRQT